MTTGKTIALTTCTFDGKVISLLFNMLPRLVIAFLLRNKCVLISWLQSSSVVIWGSQKITCVTAYTFPASICHEVIRLDAMILVFSFFKVEFQARFLTLFFHPHQEAL